MGRITHEGEVLPEWIDRNGHMNLAFYIVLFDAGTDGLFDALGLGAEYTERTADTIFAVETHTLYERELKLGERVRIASWVIGGDAKRLHCAHEMHNMDGQRVAAFEVMSLHVGMASRRVCPFPADRQAAIQAMAAEHAADRPSFVGRRIALPG